jgi:hypothetical protein
MNDNVVQLFDIDPDAIVRDIANGQTAFDVLNAIAERKAQPSLESVIALQNICVKLFDEFNAAVPTPDRADWIILRTVTMELEARFYPALLADSADGTRH